MVQLIDSKGTRVFRVRYGLVAVVMLLSWGCGEPKSATRQVADPAMEASRAAAIQDSSLHQSADQRPVDQPVDSAQLSTSLRYNESGDQIYIPGRGWMDAAELWDLYFNDLSQLPADLDFSALHSLR